MSESIRQKRLRYEAEIAREPREQLPLRERAVRRENVMPIAEIEALARRVLGKATADKVVEWLGVSRRNADRWFSGQSTWPPAVISLMKDLEPLVDEMLGEMEEVVEHYVSRGVPENLVRIRMKEFSKALSDVPPPKPPSPEREVEDMSEPEPEQARGFGM